MSAVIQVILGSKTHFQQCHQGSKPFWNSICKSLKDKPHIQKNPSLHLLELHLIYDQKQCWLLTSFTDLSPKVKYNSPQMNTYQD